MKQAGNKKYKEEMVGVVEELKSLATEPIQGQENHDHYSEPCQMHHWY